MKDWLGIALPLATVLAVGGCSDRTPSAAEADYSARMDNGEFVQSNGPVANRSRILPGFGGNASPAAASGSSASLPATTVPPPKPGAVAPSAPAAHTGGSLPDGEYACYGSGSTVLAGMGFRVSGGRYTDLDGGNAGTVAVTGTDVVFTGGHMSTIGGGRDFRGKSFRVGKQAVCEKW